MKHLDDGEIFELVNHELDSSSSQKAEEHLSACQECGEIASKLNVAKRGFEVCGESFDSRRFVNAVMARVDEHECRRWNLWRDVRNYFAPVMLAAASVLFVFVGKDYSEFSYDRGSSHFEEDIGLISGDVDGGLMLLGADEVDGGLVL